MGQQPFMILSHGRSGSNFLNDLIQIHPLLECIDEPFSMHTMIFKEVDLIPWYAKDFCEETLHPSLKSCPHVILFLRNLREFLTNPYDSQIRGMKETRLFEKLEWLKQFLPQLKIVFLVRDPRAVVYSSVKIRMYEWDYIKKIQWHSLFDVDIEDPIKLCTRSWKTRFWLAKEGLKLFEHFVVRLEDIVLEPDKYLEELFNFIGTCFTVQQRNFFCTSHSQSRGSEFSTFRTQETILNSWKKGLFFEAREYIESNLQEEMVSLKYL